MVASLPYSRNYLQESLTDGLCSSPLPRFRRRRGGSRPAWAPSLQSSSPCRALHLVDEDGYADSLKDEEEGEGADPSEKTWIV